MAYDLFLGSGGCTPVGSHAYEVMIWLAHYGDIQPIGYPASKVGTYTYQSSNFDIYSGPNTPNNVGMVYSFYPTNGVLASFSGDLLPFLTHLTMIDGNIGSAVLQSVQAGTEAVSGSATFSVTEYNIGGS